MNIQEVKPCPFCGCKTVQVVDGSTFRWAKAECDNCGASCGEVRVNTTQARNETEIRAAVVEEWNKRIADPLQARIDELMLEYCPDEMTAEQKARWAECQKQMSITNDK